MIFQCNLSRQFRSEIANVVVQSMAIVFKWHCRQFDVFDEAQNDIFLRKFRIFFLLILVGRRPCLDFV